MNNYNIKIVTDTPNWTEIESLSIGNPYCDTPKSITASAQICASDDKIFVHLKTFEENYLREESGPIGLPYKDSCLEFFFSPNENDIRYFNIEFNSNKCVFCGLAAGKDCIVRLLPEDDIIEILKPTVIANEDNWEIFYEVPFEFIRRFFPDFKIFDGKKIRANCFKCSDNSNPPHYLSWNYVEGLPICFHKPECFGQMTFVK